MKLKSQLFLLICFVMGACSGWFCRKAVVGPSEKMASPAANQTTSHMPPLKNWNSTMGSELLHQYLKGTNSPLTDADYRLLLNEMTRVGTLNHLEWRAPISAICNSELEKLICEWYSKNPDAALAWVFACGSRIQRDALLTSIVDDTAKDGLDAALAMAESWEREYGCAIDTSRFEFLKLKKNIRDADADSLIRILSEKIESDAFEIFKPHTITLPLGDDFDFKRALDGLAKKQAELGAREMFEYLPDNLLSEWAMRDWDAAMEWLRSNGNLPHNNRASLIEKTSPYLSLDEYTELSLFLQHLGHSTEEIQKILPKTPR